MARNHGKLVNPTSNDNISAGFATGDTWVNLVTYDKFMHTADGVWGFTDKGTLYYGTECAVTINVPTGTTLTEL